MAYLRKRKLNAFTKSFLDTIKLYGGVEPIGRLNFERHFRRNFISLDPLVSWVAEGQKRKFVKTVLPKNIISTFKKPIEDKKKEGDENDSCTFLDHSSIHELSEEFKQWTEESSGSGSNWVCYFGPPRCGMSLGLREAGNDIPGVAYVSLRQQSTDENFSLFIAKQLQTTDLTKLESVEPGDLRDALRSATKEIVKDGIKPIIIVDDCEFGIEKDGFAISDEFRRFLDILMELSEHLSVYLTSNDARLIKGLKQVCELREHLEFRSWSYANFNEVDQFLLKSKLNITGPERKEAVLTLMGHDGDITDYVTGVMSKRNHKSELFKIVTRGYLQMREALVHPPHKYLELQDRTKFRIIAYCTFWAIHSQFHKGLSLAGEDCNFSFPINKDVVVSLTSILNNSVRKVDPSVTVDEMISGIEILMSDVYGILQEVNIPFEPDNEFEGDIWLTWSAAKYQSGFRRVSHDRIIVEYMKETGINIPTLLRAKKFA